MVEQTTGQLDDKKDGGNPSEVDKVLERIFEEDRITMDPEVRKNHQKGPAWLLHLKRQREQKIEERKNNNSGSV